MKLAPSDRVKTVERVMQYSQQQQYVNGRSFFQNSNQWIDPETQSQKNNNHIRIRFGSAEYFDLVRTQPAARPWLALGQNVQFVLNSQTYEIFDDANPGHN